MPKLPLFDLLLHSPPLLHLRMEALHTHAKNPVFSHSMCSFSAQLRPRTAARPPLRFFRRFFCSGVDLAAKGAKDRRVAAGAVKVRELEVKESWLSSLSTPLGVKCGTVEDVGDGEVGKVAGDGGWVLGIDPDLSGALAVLRGDGSDISAQVFDTPTLKVEIGKTKRARKRLDPRAIVQILQSLEAPLGTTAFIEQSSPFPKDGRQGWWGGGFGYGMWIGILVASGYSVIPIHSIRWKNHFKLSGSSSCKDDSRNAASSLFPSMSALLRRKKDHGRAESLLIAAYGKGLHWQPVNEESNVEEKENISAAEVALTQIT